jgi:NADH-quinone oxidoreductase subunit A
VSPRAADEIYSCKKKPELIRKVSSSEQDYVTRETVMQPIPLAGPSPWVPGVFSLIVYFLLIVVVIGMLILLSSGIGEKRPGEEKSRAYESGIIPTGTARLRYPVPFYLVAIFFLIFDVEGAYIFAWAVAWEDLGWTGWLQISFFIIVLLLGLFYIWRKGGLAWGPEAKSR